MCACDVASVMSDSLHTYGLQAPKLLSPWDSPGKNTAVVCHALQGIFPVKGSNLSLLFPALAGSSLPLVSPARVVCVCVYIQYRLYTIYIHIHTLICIQTVLIITPVSQTMSIYVWSATELCLTLCDPIYRCINIDIQIIDKQFRRLYKNFKVTYIKFVIQNLCIQCIR